MQVAPLNLQLGKFIVSPQTTRKKKFLGRTRRRWSHQGRRAKSTSYEGIGGDGWSVRGVKRQPRLGMRRRERERIAGKFRGSALLELNSAPLERGKSVLLGFGIVRQPECIVRYAINWQFGLLEDSSYSGIAIVLIKSVKYHSLRFNPVRVLYKDRFIKSNVKNEEYMHIEWIPILEFWNFNFFSLLMINYYDRNCGQLIL